LFSRKNLRIFRRLLLRWYRHHGRDLPWRKTRDPYAILVSEFMLQQTQVAAVVPYYKEWLRRFPDFAALARVSENEALHAWQGLGYYNRARHLRATAKIVQDRHRGVFPRDIATMREKLPGVGRYTANAIATFAFDQPVPVVEANTARVLARLFSVDIPIDNAAGREMLWNSAADLVPKRNARVFNSALMDLGALICLPKPRCTICPVKTFCLATHPEKLPVKKARPRTQCLVEAHGFVLRQNKILLEQSTGRWSQMWILPSLKLDGFKPSSFSGRAVHTSVFPFTHHRITLKIFRQRPRKIDKRTQRWFQINALSSIAIPSPHRRAIEQLIAAT
jgi:A/G-specific adenine glycosylase